MSNLRGHYNKFLVSPTTIRSGIIDLIDNEIDKAKNNQPAEILMKMNSITDRKIIDKLAEASQCGVPIQMIIRGICCIIPGIPGKTENIKIKGIVGRYLEHSRVYAFGKGEDRILYISSADIMTRNTAKRVEIACPIEDPEIKSRILEDLDIMFKDDIKGRKINDHGDYEKIIQEEHINSQEFFQERAIKEMKDYKYDEEDIKFGVMKGRTIQNNVNPKNDNKTSKQLEETKLKLEETQNELDNLKIEFNELKEELEKSIKVSNKISDELKEIKSLTEKQAEEVTIKDAVLIQSSNTKNDGGGFFSKIKNLFK